MTIGVTTTIHCDGCPNELTTSWSLTGGQQRAPRTFTATANMRKGWKLLRANATRPRRDYCPTCVTAGRAV